MSTIRVKWLDWVVVLHPTTDRLRDSEAEELLAAFDSACTESYQGIVFNFSAVRWMDEAAFGVLVHCFHVARRTHTKMAVCCLTPDLLRTITTTGLTTGKRSGFATEAEAVRYCSER